MSAGDWRHTVGAVLAACGGALAALLVMADPGAVAMGVVAWQVGRWVAGGSRPEDRQFLVRLYAAAVVTRVAIAVVLHGLAVAWGRGYLMYGVQSSDFSGDSAYLSLRAWIIAQTWWAQVNPQWAPFDRVVMDQGLFMDRSTVMVYLYAAFHWLFGFSQLGAKLINVVLGSLTAVVGFRLVRAVSGPSPARIAGVLIAFFPSLLLWSTTTLKETPTALGLLWAAWSVVRLVQPGERRIALLHLAGALGLLALARPMMVAPSLACLAVGVAVAIISRFGWRGAVVAAMIAGAAAWAVPHRLGQAPAEYWTPRAQGAVAQLVSTHRGHVSSGGSVYRIYHPAVYQTPDSEPVRLSAGEFAEAFAKGWLCFLLQPVPWRPMTLLQVCTIPETVVWYVLLACAAWGVWCLCSQRRTEAWIVLVPLVAFTSLIALSSGNLGAAYRHRGVLVPLYLVFSAVGLGERLGWSRRTGAASVPLV